MNRISRMRVGHRFALIGAIAALLVALPSSLLTRDLYRSASVAQREAEGTAPIKALLHTIRVTQEHRGLTAMVMSGNAEAEPRRAAKQQEVETAFAEVPRLAGALRQASSRSAWSKAAQDWQALRARLGGKALSGGDSFAAHTAIVDQLLLTADLFIDDYGLSTDPDPANSQLLRAVVVALPDVAEALGKARAKGATMLQAKAASAGDRRVLDNYLQRATGSTLLMERAYAKAAAADPAIASRLDALVAQARKQTQQAAELATTQILQPDQLSYAPAQYFAAATQAVEAQLALSDAGLELLQDLLEQRSQASTRLLYGVLGAIGVLAALGMCFGFVAARSITRQLGGEPDQVMRTVGDIAQGDLATRIDVRPGDQHSIVAAMAAMRGELLRVVSDVRTHSESVATASAQIAQGNADLSQRTEEQASALEQTAASMEQLGSTVKQNADNAKLANQLAGSASNVATQGSQVVTQVVDVMKGINDSSKQIADIITVIDGIAFQTNILALNAAVEAARAGEQGRGFAVVASEVRSLANRSAEAAKQIKSLISTSVERVETGTVMVDKAGAAMSEVVRSIQRVASIMGEISNATIEQSSGVSQVGEAVSQMDQVTQQNAALVEQSAAAAESLRNQAQQLVHTVARFNLGQGPVASAALTSAS